MAPLPAHADANLNATTTNTTDNSTSSNLTDVPLADTQLNTTVNADILQTDVFVRCVGVCSSSLADVGGGGSTPTPNSQP